MQVPLPRAEGNRDIDHIRVARPAAQQADSAGDRVVQGDDLGALSLSSAAIRACRAPPRHT